MPRGGKRPGAGRPKGARSKPKAHAAVPLLALTDDLLITQEQRADVQLFVAAGLSVEQIAKAMETTVEALQQKFPLELEGGTPAARARNLAFMRRSAESGSVPAQRAIEAICVAQPSAPPAGARAPVGKKAAAMTAAKTPGATTWDELMTPTVSEKVN